MSEREPMTTSRLCQFQTTIQSAAQRARCDRSGKRFSAKGVTLKTSLGQRPRFDRVAENPSDEGALHLSLELHPSAQLKRAYSAYLRGDLDSWGDAPSCPGGCALGLNTQKHNIAQSAQQRNVRR